MSEIVSVRDLHVQLGAAHILLGVDLSMQDGETLAVLGSNGSGKSTLIKAIVGAIPHSQGAVELFGQPLASRKVPWQRIGYAPQRVTTTAGVPATALETVISGLIYGRKLRPGRNAKERAMAALELVGLAHRAHESVQTFSGGQQQRVLMARALAKEPDLLVLDEPFAGIDRESRAAISHVLRTLRANGTALMLILHELHGLESMIDRVVILAGGQVAARGNVAELLDTTTSNPHDHHHDGPEPAPHFLTPYLEALAGKLHE